MSRNPSYVVAIVAILLVGFNSLSANWFAATSTPPTSNVPAPINTGTTTQQKQGNFMAHIMAAASSTWSPQYCDELGNNCWDPGSAGPGGGSATFGGLYTRNSFGVCAQSNPFTGSCSCPAGYTNTMFATQVSGGEQFFHQCWSSSGGMFSTTTPLNNTPVSRRMANTGLTVVNPPAPLTDWPDYLVCRSDSVGGRDFTMMLSEIRNNSIIIYDVPYADAVIRKWFNTNGTHGANSVVRADCGAPGTDIVSICNAGRCGYF